LQSGSVDYVIPGQGGQFICKRLKVVIFEQKVQDKQQFGVRHVADHLPKGTFRRNDYVAWPWPCIPLAIMVYIDRLLQRQQICTILKNKGLTLKGMPTERAISSVSTNWTSFSSPSVNTLAFFQMPLKSLSGSIGSEQTQTNSSIYFEEVKNRVSLV
jgi:hypothetical protein